MIGIEHFTSPPAAHQITACESEGQLKCSDESNSAVLSKQLLGSNYVSVVFAQESARPAQCQQEARDAFCGHSENIWQRIIAAYYEEGCTYALKEIAVSPPQHTYLFDSMQHIAKFFVKLIAAYDSLKSLLFMKKLTSSSSLSISSSSRAAPGSSVVQLAWHPLTAKLAVLFMDDTLRIFSAGQPMVPLLKHRLQKGVSSLAWMPYSVSLLAVGCSSGIILWTLDPVSVVMRPSGSCVSVLSHSYICPISSFSWHPKGTLLACAGGTSGHIVVWDVGREASTTVHASFFSPIRYLSWSPDGTKLLAAAVSNSIKVFETSDWTYERWSLHSPLKSAVWSKTGNILLFVTENESSLYCLQFSGGGVGGSKLATEVADLTGIDVTDEEGDLVRVGGQIQQLFWDPGSERLAVIFKDSEIIPVFHTYTHPLLHLAPGGFIRGPMYQIPLTADFQRNLSSGASLSVVWSNGKICHIPFQFMSRKQSCMVSKNTSFDTSVLGSETSFVNYLSKEGFPQLEVSQNADLSLPVNSTLNCLFTSP